MSKQLSYENVVSPLAELEARQITLIQCCVFPKMLSPHDNVRKASAEAEHKIDAHTLSCRKQEDVYRIIKIYAAKGEAIAPEAKCYLQCLNAVRNAEELSKLWRAVTRLGGYDKIGTGSKLWRQVGESFRPPKTCTTWTFRGFYEKALLEYERHKVSEGPGGELQIPLPSELEPMNIDN